jgi:intracellular septation protein A
MQWQLFFLSIPPTVIYVAFWATGRSNAGVFAAIAAAALELLYNSLALGFVEPFSSFSLLGFSLLGALSLRTADDRIFKLQPVAFELFVAAALVYYRVVHETALLVIVVDDYLGLHEILQSYQRGYATVYAATLSRSLPFMLVLHAAWTAHAAITRTTWWWFNVRVFGFYVMLAVLFIGERLLGITE